MRSLRREVLWDEKWILWDICTWTRCRSMYDSPLVLAEVRPWPQGASAVAKRFTPAEYVRCVEILERQCYAHPSSDMNGQLEVTYNVHEESEADMPRMVLRSTEILPIQFNTSFSLHVSRHLPITFLNRISVRHPSLLIPTIPLNRNNVSILSTPSFCSPPDRYYKTYSQQHSP